MTIKCLVLHWKFAIECVLNVCICLFFHTKSSFIIIFPLNFRNNDQNLNQKELNNINLYKNKNILIVKIWIDSTNSNIEIVGFFFYHVSLLFKRHIHTQKQKQNRKSIFDRRKRNKCSAWKKAHIFLVNKINERFTIYILLVMDLPLSPWIEG